MKLHHYLAPAISLVLILTSALVLAYPSRFMGTRTGAPSETTCAACHNNLNSGPGKAVLTVSKMQYMAGDTVLVTLTVSQTGQTRWGFEVTVLDSTNQPAGSLTANDLTNTQDTTLSATGRQYIWHSSTGTYDGTADSAKWHFRWVATPGTAGPVTFYACGLAANSSGSTSGDYPYTTSKIISPAASMSCCTGTRGNVNMVGIVDVSDLSLLVAYLTASPAPTMPCEASANVNGMGIVDVSDLSLLTAYLTVSPSPTLPACP